MTEPVTQMVFDLTTVNSNLHDTAGADMKPDMPRINVGQRVMLQGRLQKGQRWLIEQYERWLAGDPGASSDGQFAVALAAWDQLECLYRCAVAEGCINGNGCPVESPVRCQACVGT